MITPSIDWARVHLASPYVAEYLERTPDARAQIEADGFLFDPVEWPAASGALHAEVLAAGSRAEVLAALRRFRHRHTVRVAVREIAGLATLDQSLGDLSATAEACCRASLDRVIADLDAEHGRLRNASGDEVVPVILGMGKLGGRELNFSSDIDLIFCFSEHGQSDGRRAMHSDAYFARVVQQFTALLTEKTVDGWAYRVDWRLRPFGEAGPPAVTFAALEHYYQVHGREWERYALVKARPVAGDAAAGERLVESVEPFVYRRYLDFNAIGALRELKRKITAEVERRDLGDNVKLGPGGIRELEFVVQAFQLIRGGQEPQLRGPTLRPVLAELADAGQLQPETVRVLDAAYVYLRRLENALQFYRDQQQHRLPTEPAAREALCAALGADDWAALEEELGRHRAAVTEAFGQLFDDPERPDGTQGIAEALAGDWDALRESRRLAEALTELGCNDTGAVVDPLATLVESRAVRALGDASLGMLRAVLAVVLAEIAAMESADQSAPRVLQVLGAITGRSTYLALLRESEIARRQLIRLCRASPWITNLLAQTPALLDGLLDTRTLYAPPDRDGIRAELDEVCEQADELGTEQQMDALRRFRQEVMLRVAAADVLEALPLVQVSDRLTWLGEALVETVLRFVRRDMRENYGTPMRSDGEKARFAVVGYGKLGGIEMGYGSDLDLVFLHDADDPQLETRGGARPVPNAVYFSRMAQRIVNWLSAQTGAGRIYEVDLRLRPSGAAGLLVSSLDGFRQYQRENAWTWEHQALVRARPVAGARSVGEAFEAIRHDALTAPRDEQTLRREVCTMREKMRSELALREAGRIDIKHVPGGLTDVEFLTQYLVLAHCHRQPSLIEWSDNWRQTDALIAAGVLGIEDGRALIGAYRDYRAWLHGRDLQKRNRLAAEDQFVEQRGAIAALWQQHLGQAPGAAG